MKRKLLIITLACILCLCACLCSCKKDEGDPSAFVIETDSMSVNNMHTGDKKSLSDEEMMEVLSILNGDNWEWGQLKLFCTHELIINDDERIWYDISGVIMDLNRDRMINVTKEQMIYMNSIMPYHSTYLFGNHYSISQAVEEYSKKADSLIFGYLFGGDAILAKEKMGDEKYDEFFSDILITWNQPYTNDLTTELVNIDLSDNVHVSILRNLDGIDIMGNKEITSDGKEYYVNEYPEVLTSSGLNQKIIYTYTIDLGGNTKYTIEVNSGEYITAPSEETNRLLEYGFMLKDSVPKPEDSNIKASYP